MQLKIMPFGASIVWGQDSTDGNGFREHLRTLLEDGGNNVTYVGEVYHGNMTNNVVMAYPGWTIDVVNSHALNSTVYEYIPNVILIHVGTDDCLPAAKEGSVAAASRYANMLSTMMEKDPGALVVASNLIKNLDQETDECIVDLNNRLKPIVATAQAGGQKITLIDMHDAVPWQDVNKTDKTHPNDAGYAIMAQVFYSGLMNASSQISAPNASGLSPWVSSTSSTTNSTAKSFASSLSPEVTGWLFLPFLTWLITFA